MQDSEPRDLHLHTLDSLIADLVSGRAVRTGANEAFLLPDERTRSALEWYRKKGPTAWTAAVSVPHGEDLVDAVLKKPPELPALQQTRMELAYQYLTRPRFRHRMDAIVEKFTDMRDDLDRERKLMTKV